MNARSPGGARPLKVALVTDGLYPYFAGGKEVRLWQLARRLRACAVEPEVHTMRWWGQGEDLPEWDGVRVRALCRAWPMYSRSRRSVWQAAMFALGSLRLVRHKADLIDVDHMPYLHIGPVWLVSRLKRVPLVVTWHEWWGRQYWGSYLGKLGVLPSFIELVAARLADHIVVDSPETCRRLALHGVPASRLTLLPLGADIEAIDAAPPAEGAWDVMFAGRLLGHKGVDLLVDALALLEEQGLGLRCLVVGSGPEEGRLRAKAARLARGEVAFLGALPSQSEVWGLMKSARVFAYPSAREGFGLAVLEAQAAGATVVTTRHPDNLATELVEDGRTGYVCERTAEDLARTIVKALEHPADKAAVEAHVRAHSWEPRASELARTYCSVVRRRGCEH